MEEVDWRLVIDWMWRGQVGEGWIKNDARSLPWTTGCIVGRTQEEKQGVGAGVCIAGMPVLTLSWKADFEMSVDYKSGEKDLVDRKSVV